MEAVPEFTREQEQRRTAFCKTAEKRYAEMLATGRSIPWSAMRGYLEDRIAGKNPASPKAEAIVPAIQ
jgi:hypothetical protein